MSRVRKISIGLTIAALTALSGLVVFIIASRFSYPYELEWTTGAVLDHVERVREGKLLYVEPSVEWTPFLYPPGYYWVCAIFSRAMSEIAACRVVSILSSLGTTALVYFLARRSGAGKIFAWIGALMFVACFGFTLQWYDIERCDALFVFLLISSAALLTQKRLEIAAGAVLGAAFFVKQPATTFLVIVPAALFFVARKRAIAFAIGEALFVVPLFAWLHAKTDGWFTFYVLKMPAAHGIETKYITLFLVTDISKALVLTIATGAFVFAAWRQRGNLVPLAAYLCAGFIAAGSSRMHNGGWPNVLMFWTAFACPAMACTLAWAHERVESDAIFGAALAAIALQAGAFAPDPNEAIPGKKDARYASAFVRDAKRLENEGEVIVFGRGHVTSHRHAHYNTLVDVLRSGRALPDDFVTGMRERRYGAIVYDDLVDLEPHTWIAIGDVGLLELTVSNYFIAERIDDRAPNPVVGFPTLPRWVFRPRKHPLENLTKAAARNRMRIEAGLAERNMRRGQATGEWNEGLEIEDAAQ